MAFPQGVSRPSRQKTWDGGPLTTAIRKKPEANHQKGPRGYAARRGGGGFLAREVCRATTPLNEFKEQTPSTERWKQQETKIRVEGGKRKR